MEEGKLTIDDQVHKFFPDAPETWMPIQLKHLMSHTSGLKREGPAYNNSVIQPDLVIVKSAYSLPLDFKTGEKYQYCRNEDHACILLLQYDGFMGRRSSGYRLWQQGAESQGHP